MAQVETASSSSDSVEDGLLRENIPSTEPLWQLVFFLLLWKSIFHISNNALSVLLKFLKYIIWVFGNAFTDSRLHNIASKLPSSSNAAYQFLQIPDDSFIKYVVCPRCDSIYEFKDCIITLSRSKQGKNCWHVPYPNHPHHSRRKSCDAQLLRKVRCGRGYKFVPIKVYAYQPLHKSLDCLVKCEGFLSSCERWRERAFTISPLHFGDIYDGRVWHEFSSNPSMPFLSTPFCYLLTMNVDWFQPFTRTQYSVGAIYLRIQNLPRKERYKEENVILVGIIPGPKEPSLSMNSYLGPLVAELQHAWQSGLQLTTAHGTTITLRLALSCVSSDIPASRKVCGFLGHNANLGCTKCLKRFTTVSIGNTDYSGYDRENWTLRTAELHRQSCQLILQETTKTKIRKKESECGVRFSILFSLPYFDPVRFTVINPQRACAARVTVVGSVCVCVCVCVSVIQNLTYRPTNDTTYLTGNEGQNNCAVFSENAPLQS